MIKNTLTYPNFSQRLNCLTCQLYRLCLNFCVHRCSLRPFIRRTIFIQIYRIQDLFIFLNAIKNVNDIHLFFYLRNSASQKLLVGLAGTNVKKKTNLSEDVQWREKVAGLDEAKFLDGFDLEGLLGEWVDEEP